jgi:hypothetical protein
MFESVEKAGTTTQVFAANFLIQLYAQSGFVGDF